MRQIKFRGKRIDNGEWVYGDLRVIGSPIGLFYWICKNETEHKVIPKTVGQFTGLLDKNGKEIYEGDIIKYYNYRHKDPYIHSVNYHKDSASFSIPNVHTMEDFELEDGIEIIGNIYENPELLK